MNTSAFLSYQDQEKRGGVVKAIFNCKIQIHLKIHRLTRVVYPSLFGPNSTGTGAGSRTQNLGKSMGI